MPLTESDLEPSLAVAGRMFDDVQQSPSDGHLTESEVAAPKRSLVPSSSSSTDNPKRSIESSNGMTIIKPWIDTSTLQSPLNDGTADEEASVHPRFPPLKSSTTTDVVQDEILASVILAAATDNNDRVDDGSCITTRDIPAGSGQDDEVLHVPSDDSDEERVPFDCYAMSMPTSMVHRTKNGVSPTSVMKTLEAASEIETKTDELMPPDEVETESIKEEEKSCLAAVPGLLISENEEEPPSTADVVKTAMNDDEEVSLAEVPGLLHSEDEEEPPSTTDVVETTSGEEEEPSMAEVQVLDDEEETPPSDDEVKAGTEESSPYTSTSPDVASHLYEGAKGIWAWSKCHIPLADLFMGLTEVAASSVTQVALGGNLQDMDKNLIQPHLTHLDSSVLNPVIHAVVRTVFHGHPSSTDHEGMKSNRQHENILHVLFSPFHHIISGRSLLKSQRNEMTPLDADVAAGL
jgi:hypothetical protein